ncbi:MAG: GNAT family N-acetyltransferase [Actinomycetota bacterium]
MGEIDKSSERFPVRPLEKGDLEALNRLLPAWNSSEYAKRLLAQRRAELLAAVAWDGPAPVGRGMVLFPEADEYSLSAEREGCAEVRDVFVALEHRRRGVARAIMATLEGAVRSQGMRKVGLTVATDPEHEPARLLYATLGYEHAHGPFIGGAVLIGDSGERIPFGDMMVFLTKTLG